MDTPGVIIGDFLGLGYIRSCRTINKVLKEAKMTSCNSAKTPSTLTPLGIDKECDVFGEDWKYAVVIGMLMYLSTNYRLDIAYVVNQCARFSHNSMKSHTIGVKQILRYLHGTQEKGMYIKHTSFYNVDYCVMLILLVYKILKTNKIISVSNQEHTFSSYSWVVLCFVSQNYKLTLL